MSMIHTKTLHQNQAGFASIVIALTLIIVLGLLTIGFAQLSRREQQQALNKQLASQAYYAAETGINDVMKALGTPGTITSDKTTCASAAYLTPNIDTTHGVSYTCVLINLNLPNLLYQDVQPGAGKAAVFSTDIALNKLTIQWTSDRTKLPGNTANGFLPTSVWNSVSATYPWPGALQFDLTPLGSGVDRSSLLNNSFYTYLYPSTANGNTVSYAKSGTSLGAQGQLISGKCGTGTGSTCSVTIQNISGNPGDSYAIHFIDLYYASTLTITGTDNSGNPVTFHGAQALIDSTGRARQVLKRLQVRVPFNTDYPNYALEGQNICGRMVTAPTDPTYNPGGTSFVDTSGGTIANPTTTDNGCNPVY